MTATIFATSVSDAGIRATLQDGEDLYVGRGVTVGSTNSTVVTSVGGDHYAIVDGTLVGNLGGLSLGTSAANDADQRVTISAEGQIIGFGSDGLSVVGDGSTVDNAGYVYGQTDGLTAGGRGSVTHTTITNSGVIEGGNYGVVRLDFDDTETLILNNAGTIKGGLGSFDDFGADASEQITNSGQMTGGISLGLGADLYDGRLGHVDGQVFGGAGADTLYGGSEANELGGGADADGLNGGSGNDTLSGGAGLDTLTGGLGFDRFFFSESVMNANVDHITDFKHAVDKIELDHFIYLKLADGALSSAAFKDIASGAVDASDRILYDHNTGQLFYDTDGSGSSSAHLIAVLDNHPVDLAASDFLIFTPVP